MRLLGLLAGNLGALDDAWAGWKIFNGRLYYETGDHFGPGDILALPYRLALIAEYRRRERATRENARDATECRMG